MTEAEKKAQLEKKICRYLCLLTHEELKELGINGQQSVKIKNGQIVRFYKKTLERLQKFLEQRRVA